MRRGAARALLMTLVFTGMAGQPMTARAVCDDEPDGPDCPCFNDTAVWDAGGPGPTQPIQEVALDTVGVIESCNCEDDTLCSPVVKNSGKPYYQMVLGQNTEAGALMASYVLANASTDAFHRREEWCSETISYWHREAGLPYWLGYLNDWQLTWANYNVLEMQSWYTIEEELDARGRWIDAADVSYEDFEPGVTVPVPGAYVALLGFDYGPPQLWKDDEFGHSLMVNEMWVHRDRLGTVFQVEVSLLEGNSGKRVRDTHAWPDILSVTPQGSQWLGWADGPDDISGNADDVGIKIYGFGVDLDASGQPVYDPTRLHEVEHDDVISRGSIRTVAAANLRWDHYSQFHLPAMVLFAQTITKGGGPGVSSSSPEVPVDGIPDGRDTSWSFPRTLKEPVTIEVDFRSPYPMPVQGVELTWNGQFLPLGYQVQFGNAAHEFVDGQVLDLSQVVIPPSNPPVTLRALLKPERTGVRYLRFRFPEGTFTDDAKLEELELLYDLGGLDESEAAEGIPVFVDAAPGTCPNAVNVRSRGSLSLAVLGSQLLDVAKIDVLSFEANGVGLPVPEVAYEDAAAPVTGDASSCPPPARDGYTDLVLTFPIQELAGLLDLQDRAGETVTLRLQGRLDGASGGTAIGGQDSVRVLAGAPPGIPVLLLGD